LAKTLNLPIQFKRGTAARWLFVDPVLDDGQPGFELDTGQMKVGDGVRKWSLLPYVGVAGGTPPTGTGFLHVTAGVEDAASKLVDTADINADQVTFAKIQNASGESLLVGRGAGGGVGDLQEIALGTNLSMSGATLNASGGGAPTTAEYLVGVADAGLSAERVVTNTATITWDIATAGQAKANVASVPAHEHVAADVTDMGDLALIDLSGDATEVLRGDGVFAQISGLPTTKHLNTQHDIASATGTEVTDLSATLVAGTYVFTYYLITQAANTTVGLALGINYTGTVTRMAAFMRYADTGTSATTGVADSATAGIAEEIQGVFATITRSTTACNLGPLTNHDAATTNTLIIVEGIMVVSDAGDLELWHNSDAANNTSIMDGSSLVLTRTA